MEMSRLTRDGTAEPVSRDQILRRERGQGNIHFPCSADHVQDWQPYPVDPYSCYMCDHTCDSELTLVVLCLWRLWQCTHLYGSMVTTYSKGKDQPGKVTNPARDQLKRESDAFPVPVRA